MNLPHLILLAAIDPSVPGMPLVPTRPAGGWLTPQMRDVLLIIGAALVMTIVLFLWVYATRKDRQRQIASARGSRMVSRTDKNATPHDGRRRRIRKRRPEHPENWRRNPTLAEAGGLPPLRPELPEAEPPSAPPSPTPTQPQVT